MRLQRALAVWGLACLAGLAGTAAYAAPAKTPILIGAVFDITGPASPLGTPERDAVVMLQEQVNKAGGINGRPVKFLIEDNASEETTCVMVVKRLIESHKVKAIIGPSQTGTTLAVAKICQDAKIPLLSCAAGIKITQPVKPYVFKTAQADMHAVARIMDYLKAKRIRKIAFIYVSNAFGNSGREQIERQAPAGGVQIVAKESFGPDDKDMTAQLSKIAGAKPQAVVCWGTNPGPAIVAQNMKQLHLRMPLIMSHGVANRKFIELAGAAAEGVVLPGGKLMVANSIPGSDPQRKALLGFASQFQARHGRPGDSFGGYAWDAGQLVLQAIRKVGDDPARIRAEIEKTRGFVGISGMFSFSRGDHQGLTKDAFVMVGVRGGKWQLVK